MASKLQRRGRHTVLPIIGDTLAELRLSAARAPALGFQAPDGSESEITVHDGIALRRGDCDLMLPDSEADAMHPMSLSPLLELIGSTVTDAIAEETGRLQIEFSNKLVLSVCPTGGSEAWHFQFPRPGRPAGGDVSQCVSVIGTHGRLI
jgi:hypothetical protein